MNSITNAKLPIGLVVAVVAQAMGIAFYISQLQADLSVAQQAAEAASIEVAAQNERIREVETALAVLNDQSKMIMAEHGQFAGAMREIWDAIAGRGSAPVPAATERGYGYD